MKYKGEILSDFNLLIDAFFNSKGGLGSYYLLMKQEKHKIEALE